jgi:Fe-S-cluster containining protein
VNQIIPEGYCLQCKGCCRFSRERSEWGVHLTLDEQQSLGVQDTVIPSPKDPASGTCFCVFLDARREQCTVYYKRPLECRLYPFLINRRGDTVFLALDTNCPYAHEHYETQAMRDFIARLVEICSAPDFIRRLKENPWLVQRYDGVLNIAPLPL